MTAEHAGYGTLKPQQTQKSGNSTELTAGIIVADVVGAGILSMAVAVAKLGWLLGAVGTVLLLALNVHTSIILWRVYMCFPESKTFKDLTAAVFADAPEWQQRWVVGSVAFAQNSFLFLMLGLYVLTMGKALGMIFYDWHLCLPLWCTLVCGLTLPFAVGGHSLGAWKSLIWANCTTILGTIFIPLVYMAFSGVEVSRAENSTFSSVAEDFNFAGLLSALSTFAFGMTGQFILVEIVSEMAEPEELPRAYIKFSAPFQCLAFLLVGVGGYYYKGSLVNGMISESLPFGVWFRIAAILLLSHMVVTYVIKGTVLCKGLQRASGGHGIEENVHWFVIVLIILAFAWLVSQIIPFFSDLVDLLGASLTPIMCWAVPVVLYVRCLETSKLGGTTISTWEWCALIVEVLLALILLFGGTYTAIHNILGNWATYGGPFDCHCEGLWATCACSATHDGMEEKCLATASAVQFTQFTPVN
mmetsp:Transcript_31781/g.80358  ORF Transcript_31781/g.80358 Transcript_31781/m.80358 type:complete len:472 (-) Transcript_31781:8-1423(-)